MVKKTFTPQRPIDMIPQTPSVANLKIQRTLGGGYSVTHQTHNGQKYVEKVHVAPNSGGLKKLICKIAS